MDEISAKRTSAVLLLCRESVEQLEICCWRGPPGINGRKLAVSRDSVDQFAFKKARTFYRSDAGPVTTCPLFIRVTVMPLAGVRLCKHIPNEVSAEPHQVREPTLIH